MELLGRFLAVSRLNYPTPAKSLQTPQKNETPRKRGVRQQSDRAKARFFYGPARASQQTGLGPARILCRVSCTLSAVKVDSALSLVFIVFIFVYQ